MAEFTPNYRLHQWEPTDPFLREDFNADLSAVDTALGRLTRSAEDSAYNLYNLMLQNDYEGKYTGYKKALIFDGFTDESGIAEKDEVLLVRDNALWLSRIGEESWTAISNSGYLCPHYNPMYTQRHAATGAGLLTGFRFHIKNLGTTYALELEIWHNGERVRQQEHSFPNMTGTHEVTLEEPLLLLPGDQYYLGFSKSGSASLEFGLTTGNYLAGTAFITSLGAESGQLSTVAQPLPDGSTQVRLWARFGGGTVAPSLESAELSLHSTRQTQTLDGKECTECEWRGAVPAGNSLSLSWTLTAGEENCALYDYGLLCL